MVAVFNHGAIPVGSDRVTIQRAIPPDPLCSIVKGPWTGKVTFSIDKLGLPDGDYEVYEVVGMDGDDYTKLIAGKQGFSLKKIDAEKTQKGLTCQVKIGKRAEFVIAPKGKAENVFFGR